MTTLPSVERRSRQRVIEAAFVLLSQRGLSGDLLSDAAALAGCPLPRAKVFFHRDEEIVLALYARLAADLEARLGELPEGDVATRFRALMLIKLQLVAPYREVLASLLATLLDPRHELGALSRQTEIIRSRVMGAFSVVVLGASDRKKTGTPEVVRSLYAIHLALMLLWTQDRTPNALATCSAIDFICDLLSISGRLSWLPNVDKTLGKLESISSQFVEPTPNDEHTKLATRILELLFRYRRLQPHQGNCSEKPCEQCFILHLAKVRRSIAAGEPIHFLLPSFPAKSPSSRKVLGRLPDMAEELALDFLERICVEIGELYEPGGKISICSDGRVFSDLVGVTDDDVTNYGAELKLMLERLETKSLDVFSMEDLFEVGDHAAMREQLGIHYTDSLSSIRDRIHIFEHHRALFNGIQRFLFEDRLAIASDMSRNQLRNECKELTYLVIQRSDGWGRLLNECFPMSLRLSIHPQRPHSEKIGILLGEASDTWLTPWHGVAVKQRDRFTLMHRHEAEAFGAQVVERDGRPSHFELR